MSLVIIGVTRHSVSKVTTQFWWRRRVFRTFGGETTLRTVDCSGLRRILGGKTTEPILGVERREVTVILADCQQRLRTLKEPVCTVSQSKLYRNFEIHGRVYLDEDSRLPTATQTSRRPFPDTPETSVRSTLSPAGGGGG